MIRANQVQNFVDNILPHLSEKQKEVLGYIKKCDGITIYEVAKVMGVLPNIISGRFGELEKLGEIKSIGKKPIGTVSKRGHHIWVAVNKFKINSHNQITLF